MAKRCILPALAVAIASILATASAARAENTYLNSGKVLGGNFPFSEAVKMGNTLYLSGQIGLIPGTRGVIPGGIKEEGRQTMENVKTSLEAHGYSLSDVVKCTAMLADMAEWNAFNDIYRTYFQEGRYPARSAFGATGLAFNARVELECIASK